MADLRSLIASSKVDTEASPTVKKHPKGLRDRIASAWPLVLLLTFFALLWWLFGDQLARATEVELAQVVTLSAVDSEVTASPSGETTASDPFDQAVRFQASGWIEAAPYPIRATALIDGIVETVRVLEGDRVTGGQVLATLVEEDARLDQATARAALGQAEAGYDAARASEAAAAARLESHELEVEAAKARLAERLDEAQRLSKLGSDAAPAGDISQARLRVRSQEATVAALAARRNELEAALRARRADTTQAKNAVALARTELARRDLALERTHILSPVDGIIQEIHVAPGMKRVVGMDDPDSTTIATLYQAEKLQARIDVPLEAAALIEVGQAVRIRTNLLPDRRFEGRVSQIGGQADIQRNTLQAKVTLLSPDRRLRPEMLCRAEFLETPTGGDPSTANRSSRLSLYVPESAILSDGESPAVWKLDASGQHIIRQRLSTSGEPRDGHLEVRDGLKPGDRIVLNPAPELESGDRVKPL